MSLYRLDASIRVAGSHSREIADIVEEQWRAGRPDAAVVRRHIGTEPLPANAWGAAAFGRFVPEEDRSPEQREAIALAATLTDELVAADALLFAVPLYNWGVSQHFKTFVDLVVTDPRMAAGTTPATVGKPAVLVTVRGGGYGAGTPKEGWDHATPWMRRILEDVWQLDLKFVEAELTLADVTPAMAHLKELAAQLRADADKAARSHGESLAAVPVR